MRVAGGGAFICNQQMCRNGVWEVECVNGRDCFHHALRADDRLGNRRQRRRRARRVQNVLFKIPGYVHADVGLFVWAGEHLKCMRRFCFFPLFADEFVFFFP